MERKRKQTVYFKVLYHNLHGVTEEGHKQVQLGQLYILYVSELSYGKYRKE
jgi:hypothetical protein